MQLLVTAAFMGRLNLKIYVPQEAPAFIGEAHTGINKNQFELGMSVTSESIKMVFQLSSLTGRAKYPHNYSRQNLRELKINITKLATGAKVLTAKKVIV